MSILFDFDGVLVNSEAYYGNVVCTVLKNHGYNIPLKDYMNLAKGLHSIDIIKTLNVYFKEVIPMVIFDEVKLSIRENYSDLLISQLGVFEFLENYNGRVGIVSNSNKDTIISILEHCGVRKFFRDDVIFTPEDFL
tara:strand:+ start:43796 stop:44203 length:408 start_codon:yes stop_codon:yes gene_type:complete